MRIRGLIVAPVLFLCVHVARAQHLPDKRTTQTGLVVTVYAISWPTPTSSVKADGAVCAGKNTPPRTFALPSFFQLRFADGGAIAAWGSSRKPGLERTPLQSGQCAPGWLEFAVTSGQRPFAIHYHQLSKDGKPIDWAVKQAP